MNIILYHINNHLLSNINLYLRKPKVEYFSFVINGNQTFIFQLHRVVSPF